jgi:uncharacterized protein YciI
MQIRRAAPTLAAAVLFVATLLALGAETRSQSTPAAQSAGTSLLDGVRWRSIGPARGGRSIAVAGVKGVAASGLSATVPAQEKMTTYQLVILRKGPAADTVATPAGQALVKEHIAHIYKLGAEGKGMAAGPFTDGGEIQGIIMMKAGSPDEAREVEAADPAV